MWSLLTLAQNCCLWSVGKVKVTELEYKNICDRINREYKKTENPTSEDLMRLSKKFNVDVPIVRECVGLKDYYDFVVDEE